MWSARHIAVDTSTVLSRLRLACLNAAVLLLSSSIPVRAQAPQTVPEIDAHVTINHFMRTYLQVKDDRDEGASDQLSIGPSMQFYLKPLLRLKQITKFDLDDSKPRPLVLEGGYRYITAPNQPSTDRFEPVLTSHFPLKAGFLVSDRNRADLDWKSGKFNWRYRNKLTVERTFAIRSYHFIPYVAVEPYYVQKYEKWSTTDLYAGTLFPVGKLVQFSTYYEHENNTGTAPNQPKNYIGLVLELYFSRKLK